MNNPFIWNRALPDQHGIMGRDDYAEQMAQRVLTEHLAVIGPRGTGKTTFIYQVARHLDGTALVYFNCAAAFSFDALAQELLSTIDDLPSSTVRKHVRRRLDAAESTTAGKIGRWTAEASHERTRGRSAVDSSASRLVIEMVFAAIAGCGKHCLVVFDEFQEIAKWKEKEREELLGMIRRKLMRAGHDENISLMFTGSMQSGLRDLLDREGTQLWKRTTPITLPHLDPDEVGERIEQLATESKRPFTEKAGTQVMRRSRLHPMSLQHLAGEAWEQAPSRGPITEDHVEQAWAQLMDRESTRFAPWDQAFAHTADQLRRTLYLVADRDGRGLISDANAKRYGITSGKMGINRALHELERLAYVEQVDPGGTEGIGQAWRIVDPFLHEWLRANSPLRQRGE